jgi:hypothetical protein
MAQLSNEFWAAIEPVTNRSFLGNEEEMKVPPQYSDIFYVSSDNEVQRSFVEYGGVPSLPLKTEGADVAMDQVYQSNVKTLYAKLYAAAVAFSHEAAQDTKNRYGKITSGMGALGKAVKVTPELLCADYLDNAFNSAQAVDVNGVELCGTHTLPDGVTTTANELATPAALDESSAEDVRVAVFGVLGRSGNILPGKVTGWIVPSALEPIAEKLRRTKNSIGNANNDESLVAGTKVSVFNYLSSATRWFAQTDTVAREKGLFWDWIEKPKYIEETLPLKLQKAFIAFFRARVGCEDWRSIFGVAAT